MAHFIFAYIGGNHPSTPEEGQKHFERYTQWLSSLGTRVVSPTIPLKNTVTVHPDGTAEEGTTTSMSGYTVITAETMADALESARSCPFLDIGGTLEVSEVMDM